MKVCTSSQMRNIDRCAAELGGIPSIVLMENAAISCVKHILERKDTKKVSIFCGKGNNGGDGLAIARHLYTKGIDVDVFLVCGSDYKGDALINFEIISKLGIKITELSDTDMLDIYIKASDIVVDAIFGTGIKGEITGLASDVIRCINENSKYTLSVDIPSGINADTGEICGVCIKADTTVTFAAYKMGLILFPGADFTGKIITEDIQIPEYIIKEQNINIDIITDKLINSIKPERHENSQKSDYGKIMIIGGSLGMSGAVCMSALSCIKSGAGLVTVFCPSCINDISEVKLTEPMTYPLPCENGHISEKSIDIIKEKINDFDVCLFGPGIGRSKAVINILSEILKISKIPVIIDADGLYALSQNMEMLEDCSCDLILTPHEMEMARLCKCNLEHVVENRLLLSSAFSSQYGVTLVLKGHHTIVTSTDGQQYININGNSGMATGGSGDVLAGMVAAFCARLKDNTKASVLSVYMHGLSGDIGAKEKGKDSLLPTDLICHIPDALNLPVE